MSHLFGNQCLTTLMSLKLKVVGGHFQTLSRFHLLLCMGLFSIFQSGATTGSALLLSCPNDRRVACRAVAPVQRGPPSPDGLWRGSLRYEMACPSDAGKTLAIPAGLEPATRGVEIRYSVQLSYGTVCCTPRMAFIISRRDEQSGFLPVCAEPLY